MKRAAIAAVALVWMSCGGLTTPAPDTVAIVDGDPLAWSQFESYLESTGGSSALGFSSTVSSRLLDQFLDEELLRCDAVSRGLVEASATRREAAAALIQSVIGDMPTAASVRMYYQRHRDEFIAPERVRLRQILLDDRQSADTAEQELIRGDDFGAVARRWSIDPSSERGGDQGVLSRKDLPTSLAAPILALAPGEISGVVETEYGFHIFQVVERWPEGPKPFDEVEKSIAERLHRDAVERQTRRLVAAARHRYNVLVIGRNLPFAYSGEYPLEKE